MSLRRLLIAAIFPIIALPTLQAQDEANHVRRYSLNVGDFSALVVEDAFNVVYRCVADSTGMAVFDTTKGIADNILFENNSKGRLTISKCFHEEGQMMEGLPVIRVYSRFLTEVKNFGDSTVRVDSIKPTAEFQATVIGNGSIVVRGLDVSKFSGAIKTGNGNLVATGECETLSLSNTGTGTIQTDDLRAAKGNCRFFGTGTSGCWVTGQLTVKGTSGTLYYRGTPERIRNYSMGVKIISIDTGAEFR